MIVLKRYTARGYFYGKRVNLDLETTNACERAAIYLMLFSKVKLLVFCTLHFVDNTPRLYLNFFGKPNRLYILGLDLPGSSRLRLFSVDGGNMNQIYKLVTII